MKNSNRKSEDESGSRSPEDHRDTIDVCTGAYDWKHKYDIDVGKDWVPPEVFKCHGIGSGRVVATHLKTQLNLTEAELALVKRIPTGKASLIADGDASLAQRIAFGRFKVTNSDESKKPSFDFSSKKKGS
jgi:hypothetical protein